MLQVKPDAVSGPSLVGRDHELEVFEQALVRLAGGSSQVIELTGDPGIGKTRLLAELGRLAAGRGVPVLDGRAQHGGQRIPFYALVDALDDRVAGLGQAGERGAREPFGSKGSRHCPTPSHRPSA